MVLAVLPGDCSEPLLSSLREEAGARGWSIEASRGSEQTVLAVAGADTAQLEELLAPHVEADVFGLLKRRDYERLARRRKVMNALVAGLTLLVFLTLLVPALGFLRAPTEALSARDVFRVASADEIPVAGSKLVRVDGERLLVVRLPYERFYALSATCTYADACLLVWSSERLQLVCPCGGGVFDVYGNVVEGPPFIPLRSHPLEVVGDGVYVRRG